MTSKKLHQRAYKTSSSANFKSLLLSVCTTGKRSLQCLCQDRSQSPSSMYALVALCLVSVALASPPAAKYPAGVSPAACPHFPYCDPLVDPVTGHVRQYADDKTYGHGYGHYAHGPAYGPTYVHAAPAYKAVVPAYKVAAPYGLAHGPAYGPTPYAAKGVKEYPAGVDPYACPDYPYCGPKQVTNQGIPASVAYAKAGYYGGPAKYPAGVSPALCPNYPYCPTH
ncbi:unnamed protein product [Cyprideis torosa]|uniref:Uncharacterized protein n=1 Tax=Cyprideis torosa TaxID=163714 RepID=A0A7R8W9A1_9CRUS|nr:unnamed protein product [Cyprideis torosa]CAG0889583.1 unnamed protein product [Cyprideis torosa]